jgi:hypothetical protein
MKIKRRRIFPLPGPGPFPPPPQPFPNRLLPAGRKTPIAVYVALRQRGPLANANGKQRF